MTSRRRRCLLCPGLAILLLVLSGRPVAADGAAAWLLSPPPPPSAWWLGQEATMPACGRFRLLPADERFAECPESAVAMAGQPQPSGTEAPEADPALAKQPPSKLWTYAIPAGVVAGSAANALLETPHQSFHLGQEGWFGRNSYAGGADKVSHFVDYYIISKELSYLYDTLGYSRTQAIWAGLGISLLGGIVNELGDGLNRYGFSYQDLTMDAAGAISAAAISALGAHDLIGFRRGFLLPPYSDPACCPPGAVGEAYSSQIYTADLKLAGVARRLNLNVGPLRYLLVSVTYGTKGYATGVAALEQRQVGFELGLNIEEILNSLGVNRKTWWGYTLHVVLDNVRVPFTSVGFQVDLNSGQWFGPGNGNGH